MNDFPNIKLLLIDDEPDNLKMLVIALADYGFSILTATSGSEGLECARREQPDLILLDIQMPRMDGFTVCQALKANRLTQAIPLIFLTALNDVAHKVKGFELGATDYLTKPVMPQELYARVTTHLNQQRLQRNLLRRLEAYQSRFGTLDKAADIPRHHLRQVKQARELLLKDLRNPPSLEELARTVGSNPNKLSKDFQILYGMTVFDWLSDYRLQEAAALLRDTHFSIAHIAGEVGYSSGANFATAFKRRFGATPREYRKSPTPG